MYKSFCLRSVGTSLPHSSNFNSKIDGILYKNETVAMIDNTKNAFEGVHQTRIFNGYWTARNRSTVMATQVHTDAVCAAKEIGYVTKAVFQKNSHTNPDP